MNPSTAVVTIVLLSLSSTAAVAQSRATAPARAAVVQTDEPCEEFTKAIRQYMTARAGVQSEVPPLRVTSDVAEIRDRSNALALAMQRARPNPRQGEFFDAQCSRAIAQRLARALEGYDAADFIASLSDDPSDVKSPRVHMRYPEASAVATMPANFLQVLPQLPAALEYRLIGRDLVLRDVDAALILDYFVAAVPAPSSRVPQQ